MRAKGVSIDAQQAVARARRKDRGQQRMPRDGRWTAPAAWRAPDGREQTDSSNPAQRWCAFTRGAWW